MALRRITGDEFVRRVFESERDFSRISLDGFDLQNHNRFSAIQDYLMKQDLLNNPFVFNDASVEYLKAQGIHCPFLKAKSINLRGADLRNADLRKAYLRGAHLGEANLRRTDLGGAYLEGANLAGAKAWRANLGGAYLEGANLAGADLGGANLGRADLRNADLRGANLERADLRNADLRGVGHLEDVIGLRMAKFGETRVTDKERVIVLSKLGLEGWFEIVE